MAQHYEAKHAHMCAMCDRKFGSDSALCAHFKAKHKKRRKKRKCKKKKCSSGTAKRLTDQNHCHNSPFENVFGEWVSRLNFVGRKSFGQFECSKCGNSWSSAHAYSQFTQGCKQCEYNELPCCLWQNDPAVKRLGVFAEEGDTVKPHHASRCEACKRGVCDANKT